MNPDIQTDRQTDRHTVCVSVLFIVLPIYWINCKHKLVRDANCETYKSCLAVLMCVFYHVRCFFVACNSSCWPKGIYQASYKQCLSYRGKKQGHLLLKLHHPTVVVIHTSPCVFQHHSYLRRRRWINYSTW